MSDSFVPTKMPMDIKTNWIRALRSGNYLQGKYRLKTVETDGSTTFCCLGVLQQCIDGNVEMKYNQLSESYPSSIWLEDHNISVNSVHADMGNMLFKYNNEMCSASDLNDTHMLSFKQIADIVEEQVIGF